MTVSSQTSSVSYLGDGVTTLLPVPFYFLAQTDLVVTRVNADASVTTLVLGSDYSVSGAGVQSGGAVTMFAAQVVGVQILINRVVPATQETDYVANDPFPAESHERALDKLTMLVQQAFSYLGRALLRPVGKNDYDAQGRKIVNLGDGAADPDAVNIRTMRSYVDGAIAGVIGGFGYFLQAGAGAIARTFQSKLRDTVSVKDFGAVGDGVTDDSDAIQAALFSTGKPIFFPVGDYRITKTLYRVDGALVGEGFRSRLIFENMGGADGIVFAPVTYQATSGASHLAMIAKGSNGGRAFSTPYDAVQYNTLYSNWKWDHLLFAGYTSPSLGTNNAFETIETWMCGIEQGDGFSCTVDRIYTRGNYRSDTDPSLQVQSCFLRLNAASALLTAYIGKFTATNIYRGVEIGDRCFFQIQRFDIAHSFDGIYQIGLPGNVYGESKVMKGNINAQHFGVYFESIGTREIDGVVVRRHRFGWKGATYDWQGIRLVDCTYMWVTNCQIAPDESGGSFTGTHYGMQLVDCGGVTITDPVYNPGLDRAILLNNCTMTIIDGVKTFQNEATDIILRAINNTRSSRFGSYVKVSTFIGEDYSADGTITPGAIQQNQRNVIPEGALPQYLWRRSSSALNEKIWKAATGATTWALQLTSDDETTNANGLILTRSGTALTQADLRVAKLILANGPSINVGAASPEGAVTANQGSTYMRTAGGAATSFYVKESGTGNTGWVAK